MRDLEYPSSSYKKAKDIINVARISIGHFSEADALIIKILTDNILMLKAKEILSYIYWSKLKMKNIISFCQSPV